MAAGIATVAIVTAALAERFVHRDRDRDAGAVGDRLDRIERELRELRRLLERGG